MQSIILKVEVLDWGISNTYAITKCMHSMVHDCNTTRAASAQSYWNGASFIKAASKNTPEISKQQKERCETLSHNAQGDGTFQRTYL